MLIALVRFPKVPSDHDDEFRDWFAWSNQRLADAEGLRNRRLLRATDGEYGALVEHESAATFAAMHAAPAAAKVQERLRQVIPELPRATQFEVVTGLAVGCCPAGGAVDPGRSKVPSEGEALAGTQGCCHAS